MHSLSNTRRLILLVLITASVLMLTACGGASTLVRGRVIGGSLGQAVAAAPGDERLREDGFPEMEVYVLSKGGNPALGRGIYAQAVTDELGDFELKFRPGTFPSDIVEIRVEGEGIYTARSTMYMPKAGDALLCIVIPEPGYVRPESNRSPQE